MDDLNFRATLYSYTLIFQGVYITKGVGNEAMSLSQ
jgi:hypothetical protein